MKFEERLRRLEQLEHLSHERAIHEIANWQELIVVPANTWKQFFYYNQLSFHWLFGDTESWPRFTPETGRPRTRIEEDLWQGRGRAILDAVDRRLEGVVRPELIGFARVQDFRSKGPDITLRELYTVLGAIIAEAWTTCLDDEALLDALARWLWSEGLPTPDHSRQGIEPWIRRVYPTWLPPGGLAEALQAWIYFVDSDEDEGA